ncbi:MAG: hypothetical protein HY898_24715 [Deltaproteobacteria bacterium]|nr:hypothetical protein [Deltaproteobacteria bacterium]
MPAAEVVKKVEEAGLTISTAHVHTIRSQTKRAASKGTKGKKPAAKKDSKPVAAAKAPKGPKARKASKKRAAPKASGKAKKPSKAEFVMSLPITTPVKEVVAAAAKAGITISENYVYIVRNRSKKGASTKAEPTKVVAKPSKAKAKARAKAKSEAPAHKAPASPAMSHEMVFVRLALDIGLQRAKDLLSAVDDKIAALVAAL